MKKTAFLLLVLFLSLVSVQTGAQTWSTAQQEVIDQVEKCFNSWWPATAGNDLNIFLKACPCDDDFAIWNTSFGAPVGIDAVKDIFAGGVAAPGEEPVMTVRPTRVKVAGDMAVIFYYIDIYQVDSEASFMNLHASKRMSVFHQVGGKWQLAADMTAVVAKE